MEKPKTNYLNLILISLCFVLFTAGVYYLGRQSVKNIDITATPTNSPIAVLSTVTEVPTNVTGSITDWKTYTSYVQGYSIKVPANYIVEDTTIANTVIFCDKQSWTSIGMGPSKNNLCFMVSGPSHEDLKYKSLNDYIEKGEKEDSGIVAANISWININGQKTALEGGGVNRYYLFNKGYIYTIDISSLRPGFSNELNQILSTFKFAENNDETSNWKSYKIQFDSIKLTIKAPSSWKAEGLFDEKYKDIYKEPLLKESTSFSVISLSNPKLGVNPVYKEFPANFLSIIVQKGDFAKDSVGTYRPQDRELGLKAVDYFPGYSSYEIKRTFVDQPLDWQGDGSPPMPKTITERRVYVQISPQLSYIILYSIENDKNKNNDTISLYDKIISTIKFDLL